MPPAGAVEGRSGDAVARDDRDTVSRMGKEIGPHAADGLSGCGDLSEPEILLRMAALARQGAIAQSCDGYRVDQALGNEAMNGIAGPILASIAASSGGDLPLTIAVSACRVVPGGCLAAGAAEPDAVCALGQQLRASLSGRDGASRPICTSAD